jgi:hypothetical protein
MELLCLNAWGAHFGYLELSNMVKVIVKAQISHVGLESSAYVARFRHEEGCNKLLKLLQANRAVL